jgi:hypothetical protein
MEWRDYFRPAVNPAWSDVAACYSAVMNVLISTRSGFKFGLLASLVFSLAAVAQQDTWRTFTEPTGHFSFLMPGEPKRQTQKDESHSEGPIVTDTYVINQGNVYLAGLTQYPPAAVLPDDEELNADRDNFNKAVSATVVSEDRSKYAGFPSIEFKSKGDKGTFHVLMVKADHRVYSVATVYQGSSEPAECVKFMKSLKLINP